MADLDVAVKLRFVALGADKLRIATRDLTAFGRASKGLSTAATGRLSGDLTRVWTASVKLGGALDRTAGAATRTAAGLGRIGNEARGMDRTRVAIQGVGKAAAATQVKVSAMARAMSQSSIAAARLKAGMSAAGLAAASQRGRGLSPGAREGLAEAASRVSPDGYLIGAGSAVAAGAVLGSGVAAGGAAAAFGAKKAIDFDAAMAEVRKKVQVPAGRSMAELEGVINRTARAVGIAREEVAALAAEAGANGIAFDDMSRFINLAAKAAKGWDMTPREAGEKLAKLKTNLQATLPVLEDYADKINKLGDTGAAKERDILEAFLRSAGPAKIADVDYDTTLATMSGMLSIGMPEEVASRWFNSFVSTLRTASSKGMYNSKGALTPFGRGMKALGLDPNALTEGMKTKPTETILDFFKRLNENAEKAQVAIDIFGEQWWDEVARAGGSLSEVVKNLQILAGTDWKGSLQQNLNVELETTRNHLERMKVLVDQIGAGLMGWTLKPINDQLDKLLGMYDRWSEGRAVADKFRQQALANPQGESVANYEKRLGLDTGVPPSSSSAKTPPGGGGSIVSLGRELQAQGLRVSEHPAFGGVHPVHHGTGHYQGRAIDVNVGTGVNEASNPGAGAKFDALAAGLRARGYRVIWRAPGHYDHMHVETPAGFGRGLLRRRSGPPAPAAAAPAPAPGRQSRLGPTFHIGALHLHGVNDPAKLHRQMTAFADRRIRSTRDAALHDVT